MNAPQLIPKATKRKRQPTAEVMREQLRLAADRIIDLETRIDSVCEFLAERSARSLSEMGGRNFHLEIRSPQLPWWRRIFRRNYEAQARALQHEETR